MSDVFEAFGIKSLSPSQLSTWAGDRGQWYAKHRAKVKDDAGPAAWRGDAVEAGLHAVLHGVDAGEAFARAKEAFELRSADWAKAHDGEFHADADEEFESVAPALERATKAAKELELCRPTSYQGGVESFPHPRIAAKVWGKFDWAFPPCSAAILPATLDLKTTGQLPSEPKTEHAMAACLYAFGRNEKLARILYVSTAGKPKIEYRCFDLDADKIEFFRARAADLIAQIAVTLKAAIAISEYECVTPEVALAELCRPNLLARGGGVFPLWKDEFKAASLDAVKAWSN